MNHAVISTPRSGSRTLAHTLARTQNTDIGFIHFAESVDSKCLSYEELVSKEWVLHGHWHTLHKLSADHQSYIRENCKIHHINRNHEHRFVSAMLVMHTGNIDFSRDQIPEYLPENLVYTYIDRMKPSYDNFVDWTIDTVHDFDVIYNNFSSTNFQLNTSSIKNYDDLSELYNGLIKEEKYKWTF